MAIPHIIWTQPLNSPATVADSHILRNDLVTLSRKSPTSPAIAGVEGGKYFARFNDVDRTINPFVDNSGTPAADVPANTVYTFVDRGHISLEGGVWELLPFSSGVSPATTVEYVDFAGTGHSPYPESYGQVGANGTEAGIPLCGVKTNVETSHTYSISPMDIHSTPGTTYGTGKTNWYTSGEGESLVNHPATLTGTIFVSAFGVSSAPQVIYFGEV